MRRSYAAGKRSPSERAQDRRAACLELALGIVHGCVGWEEQEKLGMIAMDGTDRREALSIIEDRALDSWDPSASFRARLETFSAAHGRWPEARSQDKEERNLASGVNLVRRLRFQDRMTFRKGTLVDYHGALADHVLDLWESASPLGPFFWWPQHADWYDHKRPPFTPLRASCPRWAGTVAMRSWLVISAKCNIGALRQASCRCGLRRGPDGKVHLPGSGDWLLREKFIIRPSLSMMQVTWPCQAENTSLV